MSNQERTCPKCEGSGEVTHPRDINKHPNDPSVREINCPTCAGHGVVGPRLPR